MVNVALAAPKLDCNLFVPRARIGSEQNLSSTGKVIRPPPPAIESTNPAVSPVRNSRAICHHPVIRQVWRCRINGQTHSYLRPDHAQPLRTGKKADAGANSFGLLKPTYTLATASCSGAACVHGASPRNFSVTCNCSGPVQRMAFGGVLRRNWPWVCPFSCRTPAGTTTAMNRRRKTAGMSAGTVAAFR